MARVMRGETDWVRRSGALTILPLEGELADEVGEAAGAAQHLVELARRLVSSGRLSSGCDGPTCIFRALPGPARPCALVWDLACAGIPSPHPDGGAITAEEIAQELLDALASCSSAVFLCRRTLHAVGECLFAGDGAGEDLCGRILVAAHHLGAGQR
jgi:hypothetical protein